MHRIETARVRVEVVIGDEIMVELLELLAVSVLSFPFLFHSPSHDHGQLYTELLLARFPLLDNPGGNTAEPDEGVKEAVCSIIFAAPRTEVRGEFALVSFSRLSLRPRRTSVIDRHQRRVVRASLDCSRRDETRESQPCAASSEGELLPSAFRDPTTPCRGLIAASAFSKGARQEADRLTSYPRAPNPARPPRPQGTDARPNHLPRPNHPLPLFPYQFSREFAISAIENHDGCVNERVAKKLSIFRPSPELIDGYLAEVRLHANTNTRLSKG